jgi:hypothetical protein
MAIHRRFLYAGLFLVAIGGVLVTANITGVNEPWLRDTLRLWPLVVIAIGLAIVVRRSPVALPAGVLAAVAPGLLLGGSIVAGPRVAFECSDLAQVSPTYTERGNLGPGGTVTIAAGCGTSKITTAPGTAWSLSVGSSDAREPNLFADPESGVVAAESPARGGRQLLLGNRREDWDVTLPSQLEGLALASHANTMTVALPGARIASVVVEADAATVRIDATGADIDTLDVQVDFGIVSVVLPVTGQLSGYLEVDVGTIRLCQPAGTDMTVGFQGDAREVSVNGQPWTAEQWTSQSATPSPNQIDLVVDATFGSVEINPIGGC